MAITTEAIRKISITATTQGVPESTAALNDLATAQTKVATASEATSTVTDIASKRQLSAAEAYKRQTLNVVEGARAQDNIARATKIATAAFNEGLLGDVKSAEAKANLAQRIVLINEKYGASGIGAKELAKDTGKLAEVAAIVESRMAGMSASMGIVGAVMSVIGTGGLVAAAGLGAMFVAGLKMSEAANAMGDFARSLRDAAQTIGITTDQMQALNMIAAASGVSADRNTLAFERFTVQLRELRQGTGTLFTELHKIAPELVTQLAVAKDVTAAIDLMAKAYATATDQEVKNALARAAFGRQGFDEGRVLTNIYDAGGLEAYRAGLDKTDLLTQEQIKHWALLRIEIEHATTVAKNNIASIFTSQVLEAEKHFADVFLEFSRELKSFSLSADWDKFYDIMRYVVNIKGSVFGLKFETMPARPQQFGPPAPAPDLFDQRFGNFATGPALTKPAFDANTMKLWTAAMGSALTIEEQFKLKTLELAKAYDLMELGTKGSELALGRLKRAQDAIDLDKVIAQESLRNGLLGAAASVYDIVKQKMDEVQKKQAEGAGLSAAEIANIKRVTTAQTDGTMAMRAQTDAQKVQAATVGLSISKTAELHAVMMLELEDLRNGRVANDAVTAARQKAAAALGAQTQATAQLSAQNKADFDLQTVFLSDIDRQIAAVQHSLHGNAWKDFMNDGLSATMRVADGLKRVNDAGGTFVSGFLTDLSHGVKAADALKNALTRLSDTLIDMASRKLWQAALGNFFQVPGSTPGPTYDPQYNATALGNVFDRGNVIPFSRGGIVDRATLFPMAKGMGLMGEAGPEAILPLVRGPGGSLGVRGGGAPAPSVNVQTHVVVENNHSGAAVDVREEADGRGGRRTRVVIDETVAGAFRPGSPANAALLGTMGTRQRPRARGA